MPTNIHESAPQTASETSSDVSIEELIDSTTKELPVFSPEALRALNELDECGISPEILTQEIADIVGVYVGIKPAAAIDSKVQEALTDGKLQDIITRLGLAFEPFIDTSHGTRELMIVSRHPRIAQELNEALNDLENPETERLIGILLGYPATATEYYIKRLPTIHTSNPLPSVKIVNHVAVSGYIHSPEHWKEEVASYDKPLEETVKHFTPRTYERILNDHNSTGRWMGTPNIIVVSADYNN